MLSVAKSLWLIMKTYWFLSKFVPINMLQAAYTITPAESNFNEEKRVYCNQPEITEIVE